jgi:hypothetical protein
MANEIQVEVVTGLTIQVQLYNGTTPVGSPIACAEVGTTGNYNGSVPANTPYGYYLMVATAVGGDNPNIGSGDLRWQGHYELEDAIGKIQGLDHANPATTTPTDINAGNIHAAITGDQITTTTITADP